MVLNCKWPKPDYSSKVRHQHKSQVTECDLNFGENKNTEGGVLVNNVDSSNGNVNVSKLIDFYNSLSVVHSYALK